MPKIDENTAISAPGTYYVYAKTAEGILTLSRQTRARVE